MRTTPSLASASAKGFSLIEMLTVVTVIGIIAAIAIPSVGNVSASAKVAAYQRNAQSICSMFNAGQAAGVVWSGSTRNLLVTAVVSGAAPTDGPFVGRTFKVPNLSSTDQSNCYPYIGKDSDGNLFYDKSGLQSAN